MLQILNIVSDLQNCSVNNTVVNRRSIFYYDIWWHVSLLGHPALPQNIEGGVQQQDGNTKQSKH